MYNRIAAQEINEFFTPLPRRRAGAGVYFVRIALWSPSIQEFVWKYHEAAARKGVILEGQIGNPDERQLNFLKESLGTAFQMDSDFICAALNQWMPRMRPQIRAEFARSLFTQLDILRKSGKTDSILKNIYSKIMCWLYYKFERLTPYLGEEIPPKILYECPNITAHELVLLRILSSLGADILLLETKGESAYLKQDPDSAWSQLMNLRGTPFPADFTLKRLRREMNESLRQRPPIRPAAQSARPASAQTVIPPNRSAAPTRNPAPQPPRRDPENYFPKPSKRACTNAWMKEASYEEILTPIVSRGNDVSLFYNACIRLRGVSDRLTYLHELYQFYQKLKSTNRNIVVVDDGLSMPTPDESEQIRRHPYRSTEELIIDLAGNLPANANTELQRLMQQAFVRTMLHVAATESNLNRLTNTAVYLLCWIRRYQSDLFRGFKGNDVPCFILMGGCRNQHDAAYIRYLSQLPVDVLILACDLNRVCTAEGDQLLELTRAESLPVPKFPRDAGALQMQTVASGAEQELTGILYTDSGIYRNRQFARADTITLRTTYDEIFILWNQELKYRPNFSTINQTVHVPVLYAKVSGVEKGKVDAYWQKIRLLLGDHTRLITSFPFHSANRAGNPYQSLAVKGLRGGKLKREEIRAHRQYPFGLLREELQAHIFDKLQLMIDRELIKGTHVNGTEYTVLATVLNLDQSLIRMMQSFDFTKLNPKIVAICTTEQVCTLEDAILLTFLNLIGFDIALFVPTGYQTIERYLNDNCPVEYQIGDYVYDLTVPDLNSMAPIKSRSWLENILKRGY